MTDQNDFQRYEPPEGMFEMTPEQASVFNEPTRTDIMMMLAERPATTKQLAAAWTRLLADDDARARLGAENVRHVQREYSLEAMLAAYERVWRAGLAR